MVQRADEESNQDILQPERSQVTPGGRSHRVLDVILIVLLVAALGFIGYTQWQRQKTKRELTSTTQKLKELEKNSQASGDAIAKEVLAKVGRHMVLPASPAPAVATIVNADELKKTERVLWTGEKRDIGHPLKWRVPTPRCYRSTHQLQLLVDRKISGYHSVLGLDRRVPERSETNLGERNEVR